MKCKDIILQFICLLFFGLKGISLSTGKHFTNWIELFKDRGNPVNTFISLKDKLIPINLQKLFQYRFNELEISKLNIVSWGTTADYLSSEYQFINDYIDFNDNTNRLVTLDIFDTIISSIKSQESTSKSPRGEFYTPYPLAVNIAKESLILWFNNSFPNVFKSNTNLEIHQCLSKLDETTRSSILKKIETIRILDPATGTSIFLFAAADFLLKILKEFKPSFSIQNLKIQLMKENLFGIDIDPLAIKISKLKLWLWACYDKDSYIFAQNTPECNIYEGDALFGLQKLPNDIKWEKILVLELEEKKKILDHYYDETIFNFFTLCEVTIFKNSIQGLNSLFKNSLKLIEHPSFKYFILEGNRVRWNNEKDGLNKQFLKKIRFSSSNSDSSDYKLFALISSPKGKEKKTEFFTNIKHMKQHTPNKFHWVFFDSFSDSKFDLIIGNPPFVALTDLSMIKRKFLQISYPNIYTGNNDLSYFFIIRALSALKDKTGILSFILPKYLLQSVYGNKIRRVIANSTKIIGIHDFSNFSVFDSISVRNIVLHLLMENTCLNHMFNYTKYWKRNSHVISQSNELPQSDLKPEKWVLIDSKKKNLINRIKTASNTTLKDVTDISKGIETGCDSVFAPTEPYFFSSILQINQKHIKPWIKGKDIDRFSLKYTGREVLFAPSYQKHNIITDNKVMKYLEQNKSLLLNRSRVSDFYLWRLGDERKNMKWDHPKIVSPYKSSFNSFAIDWRSSLSSKDVIWIIPKDKHNCKEFLLFLTAILNSEVLSFYALNTNKDLGGIYEYYPRQIQDLPIIVPHPNTSEYNSIVKLSSRLINGQNKFQTKRILEKMNDLFFSLYNLSENDIDLIRSTISYS